MGEGERAILAVKAIGTLVLLAIGLLAGAAAAAPRAELWPRWTSHDPAATGTIDHDPWDRFLKAHVATDGDGLNRLAYGRVGAADRAALAAYVDRLTATPISRFARDEQRAYWINLYNALTVKVVLDHYPVASILDIKISPGFFAPGPWGRRLVRVEGEEISLDDIEHRILRPIWRDPRLHYAVNCASIGCPNLQRDAFTRANTEALLDKGAREYVNSGRAVVIDGTNLYASSIYKWFREDFGDSEAGVLDHLRRYAVPDLARALDGRRGISAYQYDWKLNDARPGS